mgnify:CR=1 FL=1
MEKIEVKDLDVNFFSLLNQRWGLLTAADGEGCNPMTVSWGGVGMLWNLPVATVYVRPQRYTHGLMEHEKYFSLSFMPEDRHDVVALCGAKSGLDSNKVKECRLTVCSDQPAPYFAEAELTLICRKLYAQDFDPACFVDKALDGKNYPGKDYHRMYIGAIEAVLKK